MNELNATHDPARRSWVATANRPDTDFPIQNLPLGRYRLSEGDVRIGMAIGDLIFDLCTALDLGLMSGSAGEAVAAMGDDMLPLLRMGNSAASAIRARVSDLLREDAPDRSRIEALADRLLLRQTDVEMLLPTTVRQFSDMCVSTFHIGRRAGNDDRGQPICPPVFRTLPVGYDGRASSVIASGTPVRRPNGLWTAEFGGTDGPRYGAEPRQDYELEVGVWFGGEGNAQGEPIPVGDATDSLFGYCLLNDWSARGIQFWESMLGPFLGKSLATTVSPWIVTAEALAPFRTPAFPRPAGDPEIPPHLRDEADQNTGGFDIGFEARLETAAMREQGGSPVSVCRTNFRHMYWTFAQMVAHHASNGCALGPGDLIGSGTCSGPELSEAACLVEANIDGPLRLPNGETRMWLEDGDAIILNGRAEREGFVPIGFGEARGQILPAPAIAS